MSLCIRWCKIIHQIGWMKKICEVFRAFDTIFRSSLVVSPDQNNMYTLILSYICNIRNLYPSAFDDIFEILPPHLFIYLMSFICVYLKMKTHYTGWNINVTTTLSHGTLIWYNHAIFTCFITLFSLFFFFNLNIATSFTLFVVYVFIFKWKNIIQVEKWMLLLLFQTVLLFDTNMQIHLFSQALFINFLI